MTDAFRPVDRVPRLVLAAALAAVLARCGGAAPTNSPSPRLTPSPVPGASGETSGGSGAGAGGGSGGNAGSGTIGSGIVPPGGGVPVDPLAGPAAFVVPQPGQRDPRPVNVQRIRVAATGRHVTVELRWWSGVAPCNVLDSIDVVRDGTTVTMTAKEGSGAQNVACIDIAQLKATAVDLGELAAGSWTIAATGDAAPVTITLQ